MIASPRTLRGEYAADHVNDHSDQPPVEPGDCPTCRGTGETAIYYDWSVNAWETETCGRCRGYGALPVPKGWAA